MRRSRSRLASLLGTAVAVAFVAVAFVAVAFVAIGCSPGGQGPPLSELAQRGRQVYQTHCIACHASDPSQKGPMGPAIAASSLDLLRAKVLHNEYPPGYVPQRDTRVMVALPHLEPELPALAAYLGELSKEAEK
jgi:mono/diheme cytochrome c family protein